MTKLASQRLPSNLAPSKTKIVWTNAFSNRNRTGTKNTRELGVTF